MMETVNDDYLRTELDLLESMFPEEFRLDRGGQYPEFSIACDRHTKISITLHLSIPVGYPDVSPKMRLSGNMATLLPLDQLEKQAQELIGEAMLVELVQLFQEMCRVTAETKSKQKKYPCTAGHPGMRRQIETGKAKQEGETDCATGNNVKVPNLKKGKSTVAIQPILEKKKPMKQASDVISRIIWDADLPSEHFTVGYLDRFVGIIEKPFGEFSWEDIASVDYSTLAIPKHRIQYFKYRDRIVWDKKAQIDDVFGSRDSGKTIADVMEEYDNHQRQLSNPQTIAEDRCVNADIDSEDENNEEGKDKRQYANIHRPTHFVCIPITSPQIRAAAQDVQEALCSVDPRLSDGCLPVPALHLTLAMIRIGNDKELQKVKQILNDLRFQFISLLTPDNSDLCFKGVSNFRDRVIYTKPFPQNALARFATLLLQKLSDAGVPTPGNYTEYQPHTTLIKLSRPMCRQFNMTSIDRNLYLPFVDKMFGHQYVECFNLCSISGAKEDDGFYERLLTVDNCITVVSSTIPCLLERGCDKVVAGEILSKQTAEAILNTIEKGSFLDQVEAFEKLAEALQSLKCRPMLVVLRGIPGSGKSTVAHAIADTKASICSADAFFETEHGYYYDKTKLTNAHNKCFLDCVQLMLSETPLIVIDNINAYLWVYATYKQLAKVAGYQVKVLELQCLDQLTLASFVKRSVHNAPMDSCAKMMKEWENDPMAITITQEQIRDPKSLTDILLWEDETSCSSDPEVVLYTAVYLVKSACDALLQMVPPVYENIVCDHMTLLFNPEPDQVDISAIGKEICLNVLGVAVDAKIQAVVVEPLTKSISSSNALPHITLSHTQEVRPNYSNEMLLNRVEPLDKVSCDIVLRGTVGAQVGHKHRMTSRCVTDGNEVSAILHQQWLSARMWPQSIDVPTCQLFVFDFDGTLVESPDPVQGRREYKRLTGEDWPHKQFLGRPESLCAPFTVLAGPAMADFHSHYNRAGSLCVVLTARISSVEAAVKMCLEKYNIYPNRLITKPDDNKQATPDFKADIIKAFLNEFPSICSIKLWDDSDDNLRAFHKLSQHVSVVTFTIIDSKSMAISHVKSEVGRFLQQTGALPSPSFAAACQAAISYVSEAWQSVIQSYTTDSTKLVFPFGSNVLGRFADVDVCVLAPNTLHQKECVLKLERELRNRGIAFTYISHSSRCPRLKAKCYFASSSPVELDVVFCLVPQSFLDSLNLSDSPSLHVITAAIQKSDKVSHTALTGPAFIQDLLSDIRESGYSLLDCVCLVEMICLILRASHLKGNAFHCIRTFHILKMFQSFLKSQKNDKPLIPDDLLVTFIEFCSAHSEAQWSELCGDFVPSFYISALTQQFKITQKVIQPVITRDTLYQIATTDTNHLGLHSQLELTIDSSDPVHEWRLGIFIEARLGSYIRLVLSSGIAVYPGPIKPTSISLLVTESPVAVYTVKQVLMPFWDELVEFSKNTTSVLLLFAHSSLDDQTTVLFCHGGVGVIQRLVKEFSCGKHGVSLHLPTFLGKYERLQVHELADRLGLHHRSWGEGKEKHLVLSRKEGLQ